jgi:hypothetical protein
MKQESFKRGTSVVSNKSLIPQYTFNKLIPAGTKGIVLKKKRSGDKPLLVSFEGFTYAHCSENELDKLTVTKHVPKVGDLFYSSWGYDQTNTDFYQIVRVISDNSVEVRKVEGKETSRDTPMSGFVTPVKDSFIGDSMTKRLNYSIESSPMFKIASYAWAHPTKIGAEHFFSEWA